MDEGPICNLLVARVMGTCANFGTGSSDRKQKALQLVSGSLLDFFAFAACLVRTSFRQTAEA